MSGLRMKAVTKVRTFNLGQMGQMGDKSARFVPPEKRGQIVTRVYL